MNSNDEVPDRELLERYAQASAAEALAPRDAVRAAILEEGRRAAASFAQPSSVEQLRRTPSRRRWTAFATAATVLLAALVIAPKLWEHERGGATAGASNDAFRQAAARKSQPDAAELAARPTVPVVPVQSTPPTPSLQDSRPAPAPRRVDAPPMVHYPERSVEISALGQSLSAGAAAHVAANQSARAVNGGSGALLAAVAAGDAARTAQLLEQHEDVDPRDEAGRTPLMLAVSSGRLDLVRLLLAHGANPNAADLAGGTPLEEAQKKGAPEITAALTQAGAH